METTRLLRSGLELPLGGFGFGFGFGLGLGFVPDNTSRV
jgi:hypothetical protein